VTTTFDSHKNLAYSAVVTAPSPATSGTSLTITTGQGARFPATGTFNCTVWPGGGATASPANAEIVRVTAVATDTFTIVRAQEGTTAQAIATGYQIALTGTAKDLTDLEAAINATLGGSLSGTLPNPAVAAGAVGTTQLAVGAVTQRLVVAGSTSSPTTTSTTYVNMPDMSISITTTGGDLLCWGLACVSNSTTGDSVQVAISLDGATATGGQSINADNSGASIPVAVQWLFTGVSAGAHTVTLQWLAAGGTATAFGTFRSLIVMEQRR
jgi:hypothetical protein